MYIELNGREENPTNPSPARPNHGMRRIPNTWYDRDCVRCPRLAAHLAVTATNHPHYHCRPVPPFGDRRARLLIVGLAPGLHGANATGRPFTGDHAGILLYETLYTLGIASISQSIDTGDGLTLTDCRITNAVKCLPPQNKPIGAEIAACNPYLAAELKAVPADGVIVALGRIAHQAIAKALSLRLASIPFGHGTEYDLPDGRWLVSSYHCSRYNTQTRRLTRDMFLKVMQRAAFIAYNSNHLLS